MQRWSEVSSAASDAIHTRLGQSQGTSLAELARSSSLAKLGTVREEAGSRETSTSPNGGCVAASSDSMSPVVTSGSAPKFTALADSLRRLMGNENGQRRQGESPLAEDHMRCLLQELDACGELVAQVQRQLQDCEKSQSQLAGEIYICRDHVDSVEQRVDGKLWEHSVAIEDLQKIGQGSGNFCTIEEVQSLLSGDHADSTLRAIDDRLSAVCMHLEDAAPVLARSTPAEISRIDRSEGDTSSTAPTLDQWDQQVTLLRRELQEAVDEANARVLDCERRCGGLECSLQAHGLPVQVGSSMEQVIFSEEIEQLKDSLQKLEQEHGKQHQDLKEQLETMAKAGDDDVAGLSANVSAMGASLKRCMAEHQDGLERNREVVLRFDEVDARVKGSLNQIAADHGSFRVALHGMLADLELKIRDEQRASLFQELKEHKDGIERKHADLRDFFTKERQKLDLAHAPLLARLNELQKTDGPSPLGAFQDMMKIKEEILSELGTQYTQVKDQILQMTVETVAHQTDKVKKIIARDRHDREADMEAALTTAITTIFTKLSSGDRGSVVTEDDKDAVMKAALGILGSASTKAPTSADEDDDFPVLVRTTADRSAQVMQVGYATPPQVVQVPASMPVQAAVVAKVVQANTVQANPAPWSPPCVEYRQTLSPSRREDLGEAVPSARLAEVRKDHHGALLISSPSRNLRHTLNGGSASMINIQRGQPGLPTSPPQSSRRTLSPSNLRRGAAIQQPAVSGFQPPRRMLGVPSSPAILSRP